MQIQFQTLIVVALASWALPASAGVADSAANGFTVKMGFTIEAPPEAVYQALVNKVGDWWNPDHTFSGDAHNLSIEEKPMGCFCEKLANGMVRHLEVVNFTRGKLLVMTGGLGPLQSMATTGSLTVQLAPATGGTQMSVIYAVGGYSGGGLNAMAGPVNDMLTEQFTRLKNFAEHGDSKAK